MNKFSSVSKEKLGIEKDDFLYDGYLKIKSKDGWEYVDEKDCAVCIVHLIEFNEILLRMEEVPPFRDKHPHQEKFLTLISGTIENGETPTETMIRELEEEAGIVLNTLYSSMESLGDYFWNKGNSSKCHLFYVPLRINDYKKVAIKGDGSEFEKKSKNVRVDVKNIQALKSSDIVTALMLEKIKTKI